MASRRKSANRGGEPDGGATEQATAATPQAETTTKKRGPGRPKGSKSRAKKSAATKAAATPAKRGPGRPRGSKNRASKAGAAKAKAPRAKRAAAPARRGRRPAPKNIGDRIDQMIAELTALKAEVAKLDQVRTALQGLV